MGFNISAVAINKNYENKLAELQEEFGWNLEKQENVPFETASESWKKEGICDIYFTEQGTLIFIPMDMTFPAWKVKNGNTLTFALSETSMAFHLNYCENADRKRSIVEVGGDRMRDKGEPLAVENQSRDTSDIIWKQLEVIIGKSFWEIGEGEAATRFKFHA